MATFGTAALTGGRGAAAQATPAPWGVVRVRAAGLRKTAAIVCRHVRPTRASRAAPWWPCGQRAQRVQRVQMAQMAQMLQRRA